MASVVINDENLINIATSIRNKNGSSDTYKPSEMATAIDNIPSGGGGGGEWQPHPDWWDIEKILEEDTEDYPAKTIHLLLDNYSTTTIPFNYSNSNIAKVKTSDGAIYTNAATHTWDKTKDKPCSKGYKTRYIIMYRSSTDIYESIGINFFLSSLYNIYKNCNMTVASNVQLFNDSYRLERVKFINSAIVDFKGRGFMADCYSLTGIDGTDISVNVTSPSILNNLYNWDSNTNIIIGDATTSMSSCYTNRIKEVNNLTYSVNSFFPKQIKEIGKLNLSNSTQTSHNFTSYYCLYKIDEIIGLKVSTNFNRVPLTHNSLIAVLNSLEDLTGLTTQTLTIGTESIAKLTEEELAIATNKNWMVS